MEQYVYHNTSLNGLYAILNSGYIRPRKTTGFEVGYSPAEHIESGKWVYLTPNKTLPGVGKISVQLVLSNKILSDRNDYYLNYIWGYGRTPESLPSSKLEEFLKNYTQYSEIIFPTEISIQKYLIGINVIQQPQSIRDIIPIDHRLPVLDYNKIPSHYYKLINIIEKSY